MQTRVDQERRTPRQRWMGLLRHFVIFLIVNAGLIALNLSRHPEKWWFIWVLIGWGAGVVLHAVIVLRRNQLAK